MSGGPGLACDYFDGRTTARRAATLRVEDDHAIVAGEGVARREPLSRVRVSERMGSAPRLVSFADGAFCEVHDHAALDALLAATGYREPAVARVQSRWSLVAVALALCVALVAAAYLYALPWAAAQVAGHIPASAVTSLSRQTLEAMDRHVLSPSALPADRRETLARRFDRMAAPGGTAVPHAIAFRASRAMGANAFALPDGTIVVTDALVALAGDDDEILAVLAHELGHVERRHGLRLALQSSVVGLAVSWFLGDISSLVAAIPAALLEARYSRDLEREADDFAARWLRFNALSPALLASMLEKLEAAHAKGGDAGPGKSDYLASHPATTERIRTLRSPSAGTD